MPGCATSVNLPKDTAPHSSAAVEWWFFSGHLSGKDAAGHVHTYGYTYVIYQLSGTAGLKKPRYFADLSVTDLTRKTFTYAGKEDSYTVPKSPDRFALHAGSWTMSGEPGRDALKASMTGYSVNLTLTSTTAHAVREGNKCGYITVGTFGSSYYYSWPSLKTTGTITDHGVKVKVTGTSWMDHQWWLKITDGGKGGWDLFSVQLSNGTQYMLFFERNGKGQIVERLGTKVAGGGKSVTYLSKTGIAETPTGTWTSPATGVTYGSGWKVSVPGGQLTVTPVLRNQEVALIKTQGHLYWDGDVTVSGKIGGATVHGDGYTELNPPGL